MKIKDKTKSSVTTSNTINNSNSLINNTILLTSQNNSSLNNYLPSSSYLNNFKFKISFGKNSNKNKNKNNNKNNNNNKNKNINNKKTTIHQKRSNSTIEDTSKHNHLFNNNQNIKHNNIYSKYISSSSSKNTINVSNKPSNNNSNSNSNIMKKTKTSYKSQLKNSTVFSSTINVQSKPIYVKHLGKNSISDKQVHKMGIGVKSKTSYPTKNNSRKNSNEKGGKKITNSGTKYTSSIHTKGLSEIPKDIINDNILRENNNSLIKGIKKKIKENRLRENIKSNFDLLINKINKKDNVNNNKLQNKISKSKVQNNKEHKVKSNNIGSLLEEQKNENDIKDNRKNIVDNGNINSKIKEEEKEEKIPKKEKNKDKYKDIQPDKDLDNSINKKDIFLEELNTGIDNNNSFTGLNESFDSIHSSIQGNMRIASFYKDKELISTYIKKYYQKNKEYPSTKMRFYKYGRLLGRGAFGKVNLSLHTLTGRLVAIKSINKGSLTSERQKKKFTQETLIMKTVSHSKYIVKIYETYETQKHICIVMEYICAGDLLSYIQKRSKVTEQIAKYLFKQIILALQYIHSNNIVHRDIKLDNILIDFDNNIKICDFGVSKILKKGDIMIEQCGTPAYIAPEILKNNGYEGYSVDIWSAGVVLYAMLGGKVPFKAGNLNNLNEIIMNGIYSPLKDVSSDANHLISCLLETDPQKRITTDKILCHPWLINVDVNKQNNYNLFTNAERILLAKSNVDYRNANNKDDMIEMFTLRNIDTFEDNENKNDNTKSVILAPFNSSISDVYEDNYLYNYNKLDVFDINDESLIIENNAMKFGAKVKDLNRNYELNNNGEIDNGVIKSPNDSFKEKEYKEISSECRSACTKEHWKPFSPLGETSENYNNNAYLSEDKTINEHAINEMITLGYDRTNLINWIKKNKFNYATAGYYLLNKFYGYS